MTDFNSHTAVSVIGLGKLGAPLAACYASAGHQVIGVDLNPRTVELLNAGQAPVFEPGLQALLDECNANLTATVDYERAVLGSTISFVIVPTPTDADGGFSLHFVRPVCEQIGKVLRNKTDYHVVVITSTVLPGSTEAQIQPILEENSGKRCGQDFGLCYSPEFVALGSVISDMKNPDFLLMGQGDTRAGQTAAEISLTICENDPDVARMNIVNAEIAKLAVNTFVTTKITFANMLARICEQVPDADVDVVTAALGMDPRIGSKYLLGALGYGGPCFPRDNIALSFMARQLGVEPILAEATDKANRLQVTALMDVITKDLRPGGTVGVLGLSYKPDTDVVEESQGMALAGALLGDGVKVVAYDPAAMNNALPGLEGDIRFVDSAEECCRQSDVVAIVTPWDEFKQIHPDDFDLKRDPIVIDCWRILEQERFEGHVRYIALGVGRYHANR